MEIETIIEVVDKLIGPVEPVGETHTDDIRQKNLEKYCALSEHIVGNIMEVSVYKDRHEYSMKRSGITAMDHLKDLNSCTRDNIDN